MLIVLLTGVLLSVSACSNSSSTDASQSDNQKNEQQKSDNDNQKNEKQDEQSEADQMEDDSDKKEDQTAQEDKSAEITIYTSNDVKIDELTPENIVNALVQKSVLSSDVRVLKCEEQTVDGVKSLDVDFNEAFGAYVCSMGTTGEYYTIGSIVNTFLDVYGCEKVKITVEGNTLETGHAEYPGYMNRFE